MVGSVVNYFLLLLLINLRFVPQHLFTCELNGRELSSTDDCVAKLKNLESRGKVWGQDMVLQVQGGRLQLCDVETKVRGHLITSFISFFGML